MEFNMDKFKAQAMQVAKAAQKTAVAMADTGKNQAKLLDAQSKLAKAERQLGQLVYSLQKSGELDMELIQKYVESIDEKKATIAALEEELEPVKEAARDAVNTAVEKASAAYETVKTTVVNATKCDDCQEEEIILETQAEETVEEEPQEEPQEEEVKAEEPQEEEKPQGKKCPQCGADAGEEELFCPSCGSQL